MYNGNHYGKFPLVLISRIIYMGPQTQKKILQTTIKTKKENNCGSVFADERYSSVYSGMNYL